MSMKSSRTARPGKAASDRPPKPYADFPLYAHPLGYWSKKIRGTIKHFGRWGRIVKGQMTPVDYAEGWKEALDVYKAQFDGQTPRTPAAPEPESLTVKSLCDHFYTAKLRRLESGELSPRTLEEYDATCARIAKTFGRERRVDELTAADFEHYRAQVAKKWGPVRLGNEVGRVRTIFKYGYEAGLIRNPIRFGPQFVKPSKSVMRKHKAKNGERTFTAAEIGRMLKAAMVPLKAAILLGVNAGFGNTDVASLPLAAVDLDGGWITFPRPKTGVDRRVALWPETVEALKAAIEARPKPRTPEDAALVFLTARGKPWVRSTRTSRTDAVSNEFTKLMKSLDLNGHRGFYALRHTFRTVADAARDQPATRLIMGHADGSIDDVYREGIDDSRLRAVADHVRGWLFPAVSPEAEGGAS